MTYLLVLIVVILFTCVCSMHFNLRKAAELRADDLIEMAKQDNELIELRSQNAKQFSEINQWRHRFAEAEKKIRDGERRVAFSVPADKRITTASAATSVSDSHRSAVDALSPLSPLNPMNAAYIGIDHASGPGETAKHCPEPSTRSSSSDGGSSSYDSGSSYSSDSGSSSSSSSSCD